MTIDPIKDATVAAKDVADHVSASLPGTVQAIAEALGADQITITIPQIQVTISFGKKA